MALFSWLGYAKMFQLFFPNYSRLMSTLIAVHVHIQPYFRGNRSCHKKSFHSLARSDNYENCNFAAQTWKQLRWWCYWQKLINESRFSYITNVQQTTCCHVNLICFEWFPVRPQTCRRHLNALPLTSSWNASFIFSNGSSCVMNPSRFTTWKQSQGCL